MDRFSICVAFSHLEADYNVGGWLRERPSNQRRNESTSCQLARLKYRNTYGWVDIYAETGDNEDVRDIYIINVLKMALPGTPEERAFIKHRYVPEFLATFPHWEKFGVQNAPRRRVVPARLAERGASGRGKQREKTLQLPLFRRLTLES